VVRIRRVARISKYVDVPIRVIDGDYLAVLGLRNRTRYHVQVLASAAVIVGKHGYLELRVGVSDCVIVPGLDAGVVDIGVVPVEGRGAAAAALDARNVDPESPRVADLG